MKGSLFQQLNVFRTIADQGSVSGAARQLGIAAPSVSHALKRLEKEMGLPLFIRTTRRVELTEAGQLLLDQISPFMDSLSLAVEGGRDLAQAPSGRVRLTMPRFVYQCWLKPHC